MEEQKNRKLKHFGLRFNLAILLIDAIAVLAVYFIMPAVQNFPPLSEDFAFQEAVQQFTHLEQYSIVYLIGITIHLISFRLLMGRIYRYLDKRSYSIDISYEELKSVRKDCINIPYRVFFVQLTLFITIGIIFNFIMLANSFAILKFTLMIIAIASLVSIVILIVSQRMLYKVLIITYEDKQEYEKNIGYRINNSVNMLFQMIPFIIFVLIVLSLIGYSKAVQQEGYAIGSYYKGCFDAENITTEDVTLSGLSSKLSEVPLLEDSHYFYIIEPHDRAIHLSNPKGYISDFVLSYRDFFYKESNGFVYEKFGVDEQLIMEEIQDINGNTWYFGVKYPVIDQALLLYFLYLVILVLIIYSVLLYILAKNISTNLVSVTESLQNIVENKNVNEFHLLPITSNDEFGDLAYYYNKIQELTISNIDEINRNQAKLVEQERLASLGQMVGGIAHNLKTPIMSIAGAMEGLEDLVNEYDSSIEDKEVTADDHHAIASDMKDWIHKVNSYDAYMSDIITTVKGQATNFTDGTSEIFTLEELTNRVELLMRQELKKSFVSLNILFDINKETKLEGNINSLIQVLNNLIQNAIQSYNGEPNKTVDLVLNKEDNNVVIKIVDHGSGIPEEIQKKLFTEMITTKGNKGSGLGLYMSYSTIKGNFNGNLTFESQEGVGSTFILTLPIKN